MIDEIAARYGDMDANAHLNNLALESMHENARATMNRELLPQACFIRDLETAIGLASGACGWSRRRTRCTSSPRPTGRC